jgi:transposase
MTGKVQEIGWQESAADLYERYRQEQDVGSRTRLQALWLVRQGRPAQEAARQAGISRRTITRWLDWYRQDGLEAVLRRVPGHGAAGVACWLTPAQQEALVATSAAGAFRTYEEARCWVEREDGIRYRYQGMYTVLARLGVHPKVPRPTAAKGDPAAREAWTKGACATPS